MPNESTDRILDDYAALLQTVCHDIIERDELLLLSTRQVRDWKSRPNAADAADIEATMNKRHVIDLVGNLVGHDDRQALMAFGRAIVQVWAERIALRFPARNVLFYLGGSESVIVRFHVRRPGSDDWLDLGDQEFINRSSMEIYELREQHVERVATGIAR